MRARPELPAFQQYQFQFTQHIRDPRRNPRPAGAPARRMKIYTDLLYHNLESFLLACFPVTRKIMGARKWAKLVREFFTHHRCQTPLFRQIPEEFVKYLQQRDTRKEDPPYLIYLAHYEWVELALDVSNQEIDPCKINPAGDLLKGRPALNPVLLLLHYPYAVHRIGPQHRPRKPEPVDLLVFRNLQDKVRFIVLNPVSARLLQILQDGRRSGKRALEQIVKETRHTDPEAVMAGGREILENLRREQAVLGAWT
ncbi:MAG: HvfC family RiPP maturation protein [Burkholderiales bacterium]